MATLPEHLVLPNGQMAARPTLPYLDELRSLASLRDEGCSLHEALRIMSVDMFDDIPLGYEGAWLVRFAGDFRDTV